MPRNASGNYTLPLPSVVTGTVIESLWANTTMNDLAASVTDSLDRYGRGGMVAPFRMVDGTVSTPAISFSSETNTGLYKPSAGVVSLSVLGAEVQTWTSAATTLGVDLNVLGDFNVLGQFEIDGDMVLADNRSVAWGDVSTRLNGNGTTDTITAWTAGLERLRLTANGEFLIGTTAVTLPGPGRGYIGVNGATDAVLAIDVGGATKAFFQSSASVARLGTTVALPLSIETAAAQRIHIGASGAVGIPAAANVGIFDVLTTGAGIISKSTSQGGTVAHLGVYNQNVDGLQWYAAMNGPDIDIHNPRGNQVYWIGGVARFAVTPTGAQAVFNFTAINGSNTVEMTATTEPFVRWFYAGVIEWRLIAKNTGALEFNVGGTTFRACLTTGGAWCVLQSAGGLSNSNSQTMEGLYGVNNHISGTPSGTNWQYFAYAGSAIGAIQQSGTTGCQFLSLSDANDKEGIVDLEDVGPIIDALKPRRFTFVTEPGKEVRGLIAQEVYAVFPEMVGYNPTDDWWGIDYGKLTPLLLREIQSLRARVAALGG